MPIPTTVEALTISEHGGLEVIQKTTIPFQPQPDHIVIKVEYAGVNFIDVYLRSGLYPYEKFPAVLGTELSGTIAALPTDERTLNNETYKKNNFVAGGKVAVYCLGSNATYVSVPWETVVSVPDGVSTRTAAAATLQGLTAYTFVEEAYKVKANDTVLIHTVAGGVGLLFAQLCKARGATVIGTTSTTEKAELAKQHGASHVILYKEEDTLSRVLELTNREGVDAIFDGVGKDTFDDDFKMIKRKGTIVSFGNASGAVPPISLFKLTEKNVKLLRPKLSNYVYTPEEVHYYGKKLFELVADETLKIHINKEYPFTVQGIKDAQTDLTGGKTTGKLIIKVAADQS